MKSLCTLVLCFFLSLISLSSFAQNAPVTEPDYNKPLLFPDLPERININPSAFQNLFQLQMGQSVNIPITPSFNYQGVVISVSDGSDSHVKSVVIRSTNRQGARFTFTKVTNDDGSIKYLGRIISLQHGDTYEIVYENGVYELKKKGLYDLVEE